MELKDISRWFWDIGKYVLSAIIISTFLGSFEGNTTMLYIMSFSVVTVFLLCGTLFYKLSKKKE